MRGFWTRSAISNALKKMLKSNYSFFSGRKYSFFENIRVIPLWVSNIFISFEAPWQPYTGSRRLVSWGGGGLFFYLLWYENRPNILISMRFQNHYYYVIQNFKLKYVRQFGPYKRSDHTTRCGPRSTVRTLPNFFNCSYEAVYGATFEHYIFLVCCNPSYNPKQLLENSSRVRSFY